MTHIVCVDAYEGAFEPITEAGAHRPAGLGLPWTELAELLDARVTLLDWSQWYSYEERGDSPASWMRFPATRPVMMRPTPRTAASRSPRVVQRAIIPRDPDSDVPLDSRPLSKRAHGLLAEGDPLFFLSVLLHRDLLLLHREDPIDLLVMPMWGGLGYVTQLEVLAADGPLASVATAVGVTSTSRARFTANQEGDWTRPTIARHQREELSLALADVALAFGPESLQRAQSGRLRTSNAPVLAPRSVDASSLTALPPGRHVAPPMFSYTGPLDGSSGALTLLDATRLAPRGSFQVTCAGEDRVFAPMAPRSFGGYWSSRAWVRDLASLETWSWDPAPSSGRTVIRLFTGPFAHLTNPLADLAAGSLVLLGPAAADSLGGAPAVPEELLLKAEPTPGLLAERLTRIAGLPGDELECLRSRLCSAVVNGAHGPDWEARLRTTAASLRLALRSPRTVSIAHAFMRQLDPRRSPSRFPDLPTLAPRSATPGTLTVVIPCFALGSLVEECVTSVWESSRLPDEIIVVDDGSTDATTGEALERLAQRASAARLPLRIHRQENRGLAAARNAGLGLATGTFISFLDGDDLIAPGFYRVAIELLVREPGLGGVAAWADIVGDEIAFWNAPQAELPLVLVENTVIVPVMMRTALLRALGGFDERQRYNYEDWELTVRMLARGHPIFTLPRYLQRYRVRRDSLFRTMTPAQNQVMRELLLDRHRTTVASFAIELALQLEHRVAERIFTQRNSVRAGPGTVATPTGLRTAAHTARQVLARAAAGLRRMSRS